MHSGSVFLFSLHLLASLYMLGIIWFLQVVHYPMFLYDVPEGFSKCHAFHCKRTSYVILPGMIVELITAIWLLFRPFPNLFTVIILLILTLAPLLSTFIFQVPIHKKLSKERRENILIRLIHTNWIRTWLWTFKGIYLFTLVWILL